jgi:H+/gluconate symporter-like permease
MGSQFIITLGAIIPLILIAAIVTFAVTLLLYFIRFVKSHERRTEAIVNSGEPSDEPMEPGVREGCMKSFLPIFLIVLGVLALYISMISVWREAGAVFLVLACALIISGIIVIITNRKEKTV